MSKKLLLILILLIAAPLAMVFWLGARQSYEQATFLEMQVQGLREDSLRRVRDNLGEVIAGAEKELAAYLNSSPDAVSLARNRRRQPLVRQAFLMNSSGRLVYPSGEAALSQEEKDFLARTALLWKGGAVLDFQAGPEGSGANPRAAAKAEAGDSLASLSRTRAQGWIPWYWEDGLHLMFWKRASSGVAGAEVESVALLARLVAALPRPGDEQGRVALEDDRGRPVAQWGGMEEKPGMKPLAVVPLAEPMQSWRLAYYSPAGGLARELLRAKAVNFAVLFTVLMLGVGGLGFYFYRESSRGLREAGQRVNFVNQVSHELKTPLTNIRLYAELMEDKLKPEDERLKKHLGVIISESQRLSRLINNILTFSRKERATLKLRKEKLVLDEVVRGVLESFRPGLESQGIKAEFTPGAPLAIELDRDALEQVLANLINNVEKYAKSGKFIGIATSQANGKTGFTFSDAGPGIPFGMRERIFQPYARLDNKLTEGVSGTGIGLTIARDLVRMHGGEMRLRESGKGAVFEIEFTA